MKAISTANYQVIFNDHQYDSVNQYIDKKKPSKIIVITDSNTTKFCLEYFLSRLTCNNEVLNFSIPSGEQYKNIESCMLVWKFLSKNEVDRNSLVINLGGGVITDLGGFVASTFMRGIEYINIPTTLLAMVDASVGGKTGVDLGYLKNQIGLIADPKMVIIDTFYIQTLPSEEFNSGIAEILKHGLIYSKEYWSLITKNNISNNQSLKNIIFESIEIKKSIVEQDPMEKNIRKSLNFGHTLGHAIETYSHSYKTGTSPLLHGEAIAIGLILAGYISSEKLGFSKDLLQEITKQYFKYFKKIHFSVQSINEITALLKFDKKNSNGRINFVLLQDIGKPILDQAVSNESIFNAFQFYLDSK